jgi:hypothetical protein
MARLLGWKSGAQVSRHESGCQRPSPDTQLLYEIIFHLGPEELFPGDFQVLDDQLRVRAADLLKELKAQPQTSLMKRKIAFLSRLAVENGPFAESAG